VCGIGLGERIGGVKFRDGGAGLDDCDGGGGGGLQIGDVDSLERWLPGVN
jgi:hypothetical protein